MNYEQIIGELYLQLYALSKVETIQSYLHKHWEWSQKTFGTRETEGLLKHIAKEIEEIKQNPTDVYEWIDIAILAFDGACRIAGPEEATKALIHKQQINMNRQWPTPVEGQPTEHIKEG